LIEALSYLLNKGNAHLSLDEVLENIPFEFLGKVPQQLPYSIWQLAEHIRIAQWDILEFSASPGHISPKWPEEYWPENPSPENEEEWHQCVATIRSDRKKFIELLKKSGENIYKPFTYGEGQSLLREAMVIADHNSYHAGQIVILKRLLGFQE
jgi:hypothetical protein